MTERFCISSVWRSCISLSPFPQQSYFAMLDDGRPVIYLTISGMLLTFFAIGLAIGVVVSVGGLWILQMRSIMRNETGIESWIREKAEFRERSPDEPESFVFPYDLGRWRNLRQVSRVLANFVNLAEHVIGYEFALGNCLA